MKSHRLGKAVPALLVFATVLFLTPSAFALRKFCTNIHYNYNDHIAGQDYLPAGSTVRAARAWMEIVVNNTSIWTGYADSVGCTPALSTQAGTVITRTWPAFQVGSSYIFIYPDTVGNWIHVWNNLGNLAASTGAGIVTHYSNVGYGYGGEGLFNVAAMMTRLGQAESGYDFGLRAGTYNILAEKNCPGAISCFSSSDNAVYLGYDSDLWGWDHHSRSVIGHEFGHYVQSRLFGTPGDSGYCASVPTTNNALCRCDHVLSPATSYCGELVNRLHCLQSREYFSAALAEGWGHFFATALLNNPTGTDAKFAYYKHFKRMDLAVVAPPVSHDPFWQTRWMEVNCPDTQAGRGVEIDWLGFLYKVRSSTTNRYTFSNFETVFESSHVCSGTCNSSDTVTWSKLSTAVTSLYASAKANYFKNEAGAYGVDH